jgi:uncharacterized membrane protein
MSLTPQSDRRSTFLFLLGLIVLYAAVMTAKFALWRANVLMNDWAFYNTSFWNTNFRDLWLLSHDRLIQFGYPSYLNEHFAPLLLLLAALYNLLPQTQAEAMLLLLHGGCVIVAALFVHVTALHLLSDRRLAAAIAGTYALSPGILWPTISLVYGFQPDCLLAPMAACAGWALATRRDGAFYIALLLALGVKENVPAYGAILGAGLVLFTSRRRLGLITIVISLSVFVIASKGVPWITGVENRNVGRVWTFVNDVIHLNPHFDYTWQEILIGLGYSLAFLPALAVWPFLAMLGPDLLLIGQVPYAKLVTWHVMLPVTVLAMCAAFGTARISRPQLMRRYWTAVLCISLIAGPATIYLAYARYIALASEVDRAAVARAIALIPKDAGVAVTSDLEQYFVRRAVVSSRPDVLTMAAGKFTYAAVNRNALTPARREGPLAGVTQQDVCLISIAERVAGAGGKVMDAGGILVVKFDRMPKLECK